MSEEVEEAIDDLENLLYHSGKYEYAENCDIYDKSIEIVLNYIKELEEEKRITELTKISCCTAQNCGALENAIREGLENDKLKQQLADSTSNSVIRETIKNEKINISGFECVAVEDLEKMLEGEKK